MFIYLSGIASTKVCDDFWCVNLFFVYELIFLFVILVELLGLAYASFVFMKV
jgi:hypothetical protein